MPSRRSLGSALALVLLLAFAGCTAVPSSYQQWQDEQAERARFAEAGVQYKSRAELIDEAAEMRRVAESTPFKPAAR